MRVTRQSFGTTHYTHLRGLLIRSPTFLSLLFVWALNDHYFKYAYSSYWTGKISDITSLACTPILMWVCEIYFLEVLLNLCNLKFIQHSMTLAVRIWAYTLMSLNALAMATLMIGININEAWASTYCQGLAWAQWPFWSLWYQLKWGFSPPFPQIKLTMDPSDAWTSPAVLISVILLHNKLKCIHLTHKDNT